MRTNSCIHCEHDNDVNMELTDLYDRETDPYRVLNIGDASIFLTQKQAEQLCEAIEKELYDEPSFKELNKICMDQQMRIEELEEQLSEQRDEYMPNEHMRFQDVI